MAGTESTANTMSVISRNSSAMNSGVACSRPASRTKKLWPWKAPVTGTYCRNLRMMKRSWGSTGPSSPPNIMRAPVTTRNAPNSHTTHSKRSSSRARAR